MKVFVVGFAPADDRAATGGFDWFYQADLAAIRLREMIQNDLMGGGAIDPHLMIHSYTLVPLEIPKSALNVSIEGIGQAVTDWIDSHLELIEVSLPSGSHSIRS